MPQKGMEFFQGGPKLLVSNRPEKMLRTFETYSFYFFVFFRFVVSIFTKVFLRIHGARTFFSRFEERIFRAEIDMTI